MKLPADYETAKSYLERDCGYEKCFDLRLRNLTLGRRQATLFYPASMTSSESLERMLSAYLGCPVEINDTAESYTSRCLIVGNLTLTDDLTSAASEVRAGSSRCWWMDLPNCWSPIPSRSPPAGSPNHSTIKCSVDLGKALPSI